MKRRIKRMTVARKTMVAILTKLAMIDVRLTIIETALRKALEK